MLIVKHLHKSPNKKALQRNQEKKVRLEIDLLKRIWIFFQK